MSDISQYRLWIGAAIAAVLIVIIGVLMWKKSQKVTPEVMPAPAPAPEVAPAPVPAPVPETPLVKVLKMMGWAPAKTAVSSGRPDVGVAFSQTCPQGTWITKVKGTAGSVLRSIAATCSDGTELVKAGGNGPTPYEFASCDEHGFKGFETRGGTWVAQVQPVCADGTALGTAGGTGGTAKTVHCPEGQIAVGIGGFVDSASIGNMYAICNDAPEYA